MDIIRFLGLVTVVIVILYSVQATAQIGEEMRCGAKLLPCGPYIHSGLPPPAYCCNPIKEIVEKDVTCLCTATKHPGMLNLINLTKDNALNLLNLCGANFDISRCSASASDTASPGTRTNGSSSTSTRKNAAIATTILGFSFAYAYMGF